MQHCCCKIQNLLPAATIETTMEVVVDELWTRTVAKMPIIRPATGLLRISFEAKASPAAFPPNRRKALLRKSNEQMNKYRRPRSRTILVNAKATRRNFPVPSSSVGQQTERFDHTIISPMADPKIFLETPHNTPPTTTPLISRSGSGTEVAIVGNEFLLATGFKAFVNPVVIWCEVIVWHCYIGIDKKTLFWFALWISCCSLYVTCLVASWNEFLAKW